MMPYGDTDLLNAVECRALIGARRVANDQIVDLILHARDLLHFEPTERRGRRTSEPKGWRLVGWR